MKRETLESRWSRCSRIPLDVRHAAMEDPVVHAAIGEYLNGRVSYDDAIAAAVRVLVLNKKELIAKICHAAAFAGSPILLPPKSTPL